MSDEFTGMFNGTSKYQEEIKNFCTVVSCEIARKYKVFVSSDDIRTEIHEKIKKQIECVKKNSKHIIPIISFDIPKEGRFHILIQPMNFWDGKKGYDYYFDTVILEAEPREYVKVGGCPKCCCFKQDAIIDSNNNKKCIVVTKITEQKIQKLLDKIGAKFRWFEGKKQAIIDLKENEFYHVLLYDNVNNKLQRVFLENGVLYYTDNYEDEKFRSGRNVFDENNDLHHLFAVELKKDKK